MFSLTVLRTYTVYTVRRWKCLFLHENAKSICFNVWRDMSIQHRIHSAVTATSEWFTFGNAKWNENARYLEWMVFGCIRYSCHFVDSKRQLPQCFMNFFAHKIITDFVSFFERKLKTIYAFAFFFRFSLSLIDVSQSVRPFVRSSVTAATHTELRFRCIRRCIIFSYRLRAFPKRFTHFSHRVDWPAKDAKKKTTAKKTKQKCIYVVLCNMRYQSNIEELKCSRRDTNQQKCWTEIDTQLDTNTHTHTKWVKCELAIERERFLWKYAFTIHILFARTYGQIDCCIQFDTHITHCIFSKT